MTLSEAEKAKADIAKVKAEARADFLKRFFAVAVSVGFASKINGLPFIYSMTLPTQSELRDALLLVLAMSVVVGSWDFYFLSLKDRPLVDWQRFVLDIIIVSLYIVLLISSQHPSTFFIYLCAVILLYFAWDVLCVVFFPSVYGAKSSSFKEVTRIVFYGIAEENGRAGHGPVGPFVSLWWLCVFVLIWIAHHAAWSSFYEVYIAAFFAYILYRRDQAVGWSLRMRLLTSLAALGILQSSNAAGWISVLFASAAEWISAYWPW